MSPTVSAAHGISAIGGVSIEKSLSAGTNWPIGEGDGSQGTARVALMKVARPCDCARK
jgi:hypothetical protein